MKFREGVEEIMSLLWWKLFFTKNTKGLHTRWSFERTKRA